MTAAMDFRAQDGIRHEISKTFALGHCQFHTTAESFEADQPLLSSDRELAIVMDGWLANPDELRAELLARKARLRNRSDAELILHAYEAWGDDCVDHLEGEFAFVIHDGRNGRVFCAKDHLGMRPLHYHWDGQRLLVASDIAAVLAAGDFAQTLNPDVMAERLASEFLSLEQTVWTGVSRLPLASTLQTDGRRPVSRRYWMPPLETSIRYRRDEEYFEHYREVLLDSVRRASRSNVPIGCEVSGGHDSSAIFALARRLKEQGGLLSPDALGFTQYGVPGGISDEIKYARDVGRFLGVPIHEAECAVSDLSWFEANVAQDRDMPFMPNSQSMINEVQLVRQKGCRVLLDGEGGDEFVGGSPLVLHEMLVMGNWRPLWREILSMQQSRGIRGAANRLFRFGLRPLAPSAFERVLRRFKRAKEPWGGHLGAGPHWASHSVRDRLTAMRDASRRNDEFWTIRHPVRRKLTRDLFDPGFDYMRDVSARLTSRLGIELRTPMYSKKYVEFIYGLPEQVKYRDGRRKFVHLGALQHDLPQSVLQRRDKAEFGFTFDCRLRPLASTFLDEIPAGAPSDICEEGLRKLYANYGQTAEGVWELWRIYGWYLLKTGIAGGG